MDEANHAVIWVSLVEATTAAVGGDAAASEHARRLTRAEVAQGPRHVSDLLHFIATIERVVAGSASDPQRYAALTAVRHSIAAKAPDDLDTCTDPEVLGSLVAHVLLSCMEEDPDDTDSFNSALQQMGRFDQRVPDVVVCTLESLVLIHAAAVRDGLVPFDQIKEAVSTLE